MLEKQGRSCVLPLLSWAGGRPTPRPCHHRAKPLACLRRSAIAGPNHRCAQGRLGGHFSLARGVAPSNNARMLPPQFETRQTRTFDNQALTYQVTLGSGPWIVLANGLGARSTAWHHQITYLRDDYRFLMWDYRGLFGADSCPLPDDMHPFDVHARDLSAILRAEAVERPIVAVWSLGMQVVLRAMRDHALTPSHLIVINGTFQPDAGAGVSVSKVRRRVTGLLERMDGLVERIVHRAARSPEVLPWAKRLGFIGPTIDEELFSEVVAEFAIVQARPYLRHLAALCTERSTDLLASVDVPTLVLIGERDPVTPRQVAEPAARRIPGAEIFVVRGATHFTALEFPELVNLRIEKFLREHSARPIG